MASKKPRRQEWITLIENYKSSGLTMAAWCESNQFTLHTLKYWLRKLQGSPSSKSVSSKCSSFIPLAVDDSAIQSLSSSLIVQIGEARIEIHSGFNVHLFREVVAALNSPC